MTGSFSCLKGHLFPFTHPAGVVYGTHCFLILPGSLFSVRIAEFPPPTSSSCCIGWSSYKLRHCKPIRIRTGNCGEIIFYNQHPCAQVMRSVCCLGLDILGNVFCQPAMDLTLQGWHIFSSTISLSNSNVSCSSDVFFDCNSSRSTCTPCSRTRTRHMMERHPSLPVRIDLQNL